MNGWRKATQLAAPSTQLPQHPWALAISPDPNPTPDNPVPQSPQAEADFVDFEAGVVNRVSAPFGVNRPEKEGKVAS